MPQLVKGGKWVFGWTVVGKTGKFFIPPVAWTEYGFQAGETAIFIRGSEHSGGFGICTPARWPTAFGAWEISPRVLGIGQLTTSHTAVAPPKAGIVQGDRLLVVRGSGLALGFIVQGRIYAEALKHPEIDVFEELGED